MSGRQQYKRIYSSTHEWRRKLLEELFLQDKNGLKQKDSRFNPSKMTENNEIGKNTNGIRGKLSGNDLVQVENIGKEKMKRESKSRSKELFIDGNIAIESTNDPIFFVGCHQSILTRKIIMSP